MEDNNQFELGAWHGRNQAFHLLANHCLAARAQCLETIRESGAYRTLNLTWDEFCTRHAGTSRSNADRLIQKRKEFGDAYFRLSEVMRISTVSYRRIESKITPEGLEIDGETIPITPENAPKIRSAVNALLAELRDAQARQHHMSAAITRLQSQIDVAFHEMSAMASRSLDPASRAGFDGLLHYTQAKLNRITRGFQAANPRGEE
jgi:hypothetical protein